MAEAQEHKPEQTQDGAAAVNLHVAPAPHLSDQGFTTRRMMTDVLIGLSPLLIVALAVFRWYAVVQIGICLISCLAAEALFTLARHKPLTLCDRSAAVTGLILAFSLPGLAPWYVGVVGSFVAVGLGKIVFGGLGMNIFNPAMVGRAFVMMAFVGPMAAPSYVLRTDVEDDPRIITRATPMTVMHEEKAHPTPSAAQVRAKAVAEAAGKRGITPAEFERLLDETPALGVTIAAKVDAARAARARHAEALDLGRLFLGNINGSLGEVSALACLIGGLFLCIRRTAAWQIPFGAVAAVIVIGGLSDLFAGPDMTVMHHLLGGAFLFGALFIATDPVTSPLTPKGRFIFGAAFGALVMLLRNLSAYPEGVMFAILLVNALAPLINRWTIPTPVGGPVPRRGEMP